MSIFRPWALYLVLTVALPSAPAQAFDPSSAIPLIQQEIVAGASSIQLKLLACLARGDIAGALMLYEVETGQPPPAWLLNLQGAYSVANQAVGRCQQVARTIHVAFTQLGQQPQYIAFKAKADEEFMVFDLASGASPSLTANGYHVAVKVGERIYDAYTGALGMTLKEYLSRLHAQQGVGWEMVAVP